MFRDLPARAAWRHHTAREGFECVFIHRDDSGHHVEGLTSAVEENEPWAVRYRVSVDERWHVVNADIWGWSVRGERAVRIGTDGRGRWAVDGEEVPWLEGCLDVDLESSACTNMIPVHRLGLGVGNSAKAPAVYVRAFDLSVERLEQWYARTEDLGDRQSYDYSAPRFEFRCRLVYDAAGVVIEYPGLASRVL
jgi:uncharacterized protein